MRFHILSCLLYSGSLGYVSWILLFILFRLKLWWSIDTCFEGGEWGSSTDDYSLNLWIMALRSLRLNLVRFSKAWTSVLVLNSYISVICRSWPIWLFSEAHSSESIFSSVIPFYSFWTFSTTWSLSSSLWFTSSLRILASLTAWVLFRPFIIEFFLFINTI